MIFFMGIAFWFFSIIGMENDVRSSYEPMTIPLLKELTLQSIFYHLGNKNITVADIKKKLSKDMIDEITKPDQRCDFKRKVISITPNNRYILTAQRIAPTDWKLYRQCLDTGQEIDIIEKVENPHAALSCDGNLVAVALSATKIGIKNLIANKIIKEIWSDSRIEDLKFVGNELVLAQNADSLSIISVQEGDDIDQIPQIPTGIVAGILHKKLEYLMYQQWSVQRYAKDKLIDTIQVGNLPHKYKYSFSSDVQPAIYEPQMLMAYKETRPKCAIVIISLQKDNNNPLTYLSFLYDVTAISFANKGKWLITASAGTSEKKPTLEVWDWQKDQTCLLSIQFEGSSINEIFCTDQYTSYPCLIQIDSKLCSFDPRKTIAHNILKNELEKV